MFRNATKEEMVKIIQGKISPEYKVVKISRGILCTDSKPNSAQFRVGEVSVSEIPQGFGVMKDLIVARRFFEKQKTYLAKSGEALIKVYPLEEGTTQGRYSELYTAEIIDTFDEKEVVSTNPDKDISNQCQYVLTQLSGGGCLSIKYKGILIGVFDTEGIKLTEGYTAANGTAIPFPGNLMTIRSFRLLKK